MSCCRPALLSKRNHRLSSEWTSILVGRTGISWPDISCHLLKVLHSWILLSRWHDSFVSHQLEPRHRRGGKGSTLWKPWRLLKDCIPVRE
uniref:Uncharacterized protein n=1 Tax=Arundo donax TaxID=35708 RepID=A0A0A9GR58_ARUDO